MSTIFLNCFCDSIFAKLYEKLGSCTPEVVEKGTNCADVAMTSVICTTVIRVALILVLGFLAWKLLDHIVNGFAGWRKRVWEVEDIKRKQKSDLLTKLLDFQKDLALNYEKEEIKTKEKMRQSENNNDEKEKKEDKKECESKSEKKKYDDKEAKEYIKMIKNILGINYSNEKEHDTQEPKTTNS